MVSMRRPQRHRSEGLAGGLVDGGQVFVLVAVAEDVHPATRDGHGADALADTVDLSGQGRAVLGPLGEYPLVGREVEAILAAPLGPMALGPGNLLVGAQDRDGEQGEGEGPGRFAEEVCGSSSSIAPTIYFLGSTLGRSGGCDAHGAVSRQHRTQSPAAAQVPVALAAVNQDVLFVAPGILQGVGEDRHEGEIGRGPYCPRQIDDDPIIPGQDARRQSPERVEWVSDGFVQDEPPHVVQLVAHNR
jgi:hypothetical protein